MKIIETRFECDTEGCNNFELVDESIDARKRNADRKRRGWKKVDGKDSCPLCSSNVPLISTQK